MKTKFFWTVIFTAVISSSVFSQIKQISSDEFYRSNSAAYKLMNERSRRLVVKTETLENGVVTAVVTKIEERLLPDKLHFLTVEKNSNEEKTSELILIGTMEYRRENKGQWTVKDISGSGSGSGTGNTGGVACFQYTEESDYLNGVTTRKLKQLMIERSVEGLSYSNFTVWFDQQGAFLRSEKTKGLLEPKIEKTRSVATYEYEPDIKIEAPITEKDKN